METTRETNSSSADFRIGSAINLGELHHSSPLTEQEHLGSPIHRHLGAQPTEFSNNPIPPSSSQNPFLVPPGDDDHAYEPSQGNPFHEATNTNDKAAVGVVEPPQNQPSASENVSMKEQDTTDAAPKSGLDSKIAVESSDDDIPVSSMPKHGHAQSGDVAGAQSSVAVANHESAANKGPEIQNPPVQVMERPGDSGTPSSYTFPSHVFARNNTNAPVEWSTASNESLFSIYMGNTSFSSDIPIFGGGKSVELDKPGEMPMPDQPPNAVVAATPSQQQPPAAAAPMNKFNDISQRTAEMHVECSKAKATEAKAAETMREVIMETSRTNENNAAAAAAAKGGEDKKSNTHKQTNDMTESFAFQSEPSKAEDKQKQQKQQSEQTETQNAAAVDEASKSTTNPPPKGGWLSCFSCCSR